MQIGIGGKAGNSFATYAVDADGGGADVYNPADAVFTAANYLCRNGAAQVAKAVFAYNHADWYVTKVLAIASNYAATATGLGTAAAPSEAAATAVQFAYNQLGKPYVWGAEGDSFYDCSGLMMRAYQEAGIRLPRTSREQWYAGARVTDIGALQRGDLVFRARNLSDPSTITTSASTSAPATLSPRRTPAQWCESSRWSWQTISAPSGRPCRRTEPAPAAPA
jgi:hypothetical protein